MHLIFVMYATSRPSLAYSLCPSSDPLLISSSGVFDTNFTVGTDQVSSCIAIEVPVAVAVEGETEPYIRNRFLSMSLTALDTETTWSVEVRTANAATGFDSRLHRRILLQAHLPSWSGDFSVSTSRQFVFVSFICASPYTPTEPKPCRSRPNDGTFVTHVKLVGRIVQPCSGCSALLT